MKFNWFWWIFFVQWHIFLAVPCLLLSICWLYGIHGVSKNENFQKWTALERWIFKFICLTSILLFFKFFWQFLAKTIMAVAACNSAYCRSLDLCIYLNHIHRCDAFPNVFCDDYKRTSTIWHSILFNPVYFACFFHRYKPSIFLQSIFCFQMIFLYSWWMDTFFFVSAFKWHCTSVAYSLYKNMKSEEMNRCKLDTYFISNITQQFSTIKCKQPIVWLWFGRRLR